MDRARRDRMIALPKPFEFRRQGTSRKAPDRGIWNFEPVGRGSAVERLRPHCNSLWKRGKTRWVDITLRGVRQRLVAGILRTLDGHSKR